MPPVCRYLALALPLGFIACGHGKDAADRRFDELGSQIVSLQADQDRLAERLEILERAEAVRRDEDARRVTESASDAPPERRPRLRVVKVSPDDGAGQYDDAPPADELDPPGSQPRPVVRAVGQTGSVQNLN